MSKCKKQRGSHFDPLVRQNTKTHNPQIDNPPNQAINMAEVEMVIDNEEMEMLIEANETPHDEATTNLLAFCMNRVAENAQRGRNTNGNYLIVYRHFLRTFVGPNLTDPTKVVVENGPAGPVYCTQFNTENYYKHIVVNLPGAYAGIRAKVNALSKLRQLIELPGGSKIECTGPITEYIVQQQANHKVNASDKYAGSDPHKGLKDKMPKTEILKIIDGIVNASLDSYSLLFVYYFFEDTRTYTQ